MATRKPAPRKAAQQDPFAEEPQQRELAPAPVTPVADAARSAIATISTQLSEMDKVEAGLGELEKRYDKVVYAVDTKDGMNDAVLARREIKGVRVAVEHAREAAKAPVLALGRDIDARAGKIKTRLEAIESPIDDQIKAQERKESERKADLERRMREIQSTPAQCIGKDSAQLAEVLESINTLPLEDFVEYRAQAAEAQEHARQQVQSLLTSAKLAEEAAALRKQQEQEQHRRQGLQLQVDDIATPLSLPYRTSARVQQAIDRLTAFEIGEHFAEFAPAAREKKAEVLSKLDQLLQEKLAAEKNAADVVYAPAAHIAAPAPIPAPVYAPAHVSPAAQHEVAKTGPLASSLDPVDLAYVTSQQPRGIEPPDFDVVDAEIPKRPTDAEILNVVASHYDVTWTEAARWLRDIDFASALAQQPLIPV